MKRFLLLLLCGLVTFHANALTITFKANGGSGRMPSQTISSGKTAKLKKNTFRRAGWKFLGWSKKAKTSVAYKNRATIDTASIAARRMTLYAKWAKKTYRVSFMPNGGDGRMSTQTMKYGKASKLSANKFTRNGYTFQGWAKTRNGPVVFKDKDSVKNLTKTGATVKLYASWEEKGSSLSPEEIEQMAAIMALMQPSTSSSSGFDLFTGSSSKTCTACMGTGVCSLCHGTGTYRLYGVATPCSRICETCNGTGRW